MIVSAILLLGLLKLRKKLRGREDTDVKEKKIGTILQIQLINWVWKRHRYLQAFSAKQ